MKLFRPSLLVACFLLYTGLAQNCEYDASVKENQGLDFVSAAGQVTMEQVKNVSDPESCRERCCKSPECEVAMMGYPMDGEPQCMLINCHINGPDGCAYRSSAQFKVYRKKGTGKSHGERGNGLHVVPMMGSIEPRIDVRNESNSGKMSTRAACDGFERWNKINAEIQTSQSLYLRGENILIISNLKQESKGSAVGLNIDE